MAAKGRQIKEPDVMWQVITGYPPRFKKSPEQPASISAAKAETKVRMGKETIVLQIHNVPNHATVGNAEANS